ncbi:polyprenol phosphomannose-dependent alpha 1,6 mannosyltransferase MptB [Actinosynnema pretiosum]|uniref:Uncharacterized protein n=1 Tax=Actinosynnema pretiosum TaxID=42197 RepID=A0A290Z8S1_9PSEU|nr:polyprenol phosphomannose-dependent alpha 1,6 mannosyltransferase MptB [Actinosynnema pretiosum]ATE55418.1 hypothetical protein CNX65_20780 [Actinosynnema pretiosum]
MSDRARKNTTAVDGSTDADVPGGDVTGAGVGGAEAGSAGIDAAVVQATAANAAEPASASAPAPATAWAASPEVLRWLGAVATLLLTGAAWTALLVTDPPPAVAVTALAAGVSGVGLLVLAWSLLGRTARAPGGLPAVAWLRGTLALWAAPLVVAPPLFSGDVHSYLAQGEIAARGMDPYELGPAQALGADSEIVSRVSDYWQGTPSPYGPLTTAIQQAIATAAPGDPVVGVLLHRAFALLGVLLVVWSVQRLAVLAGVSRRTALWLGALNPLVLWHFVAGVHNDALMVGLVLSGVAVALIALTGEVDRWQLAGGIALIGTGAAVKLPAIIALAVVGTALARRFGGGSGRFVLAGAAMVVASVVVFAALSLATGVGFGWLFTLGTSGGVNSWMAPTNWFGFLTGGIGALFGASITQTMIGVGKLIGYAVIAGCFARVLHRQLRGRVEPIAALGLMMAAFVAFGPVIQPWYLLWTVPALAACLPVGRVHRRIALLVAVLSLVIPPLAGNFAGRVGELVGGYAGGALVVAAVFFALRRVGERAAVAQTGWARPRG